MLELYLHADGAPFCRNPEKNDYLTGFSHDQISELKRWKVIPEQVDVHDGSILKSQVVEMMLQVISTRSGILKQKPRFRGDCMERLEGAFRTAQREGRGLLLICGQDPL